MKKQQIYRYKVSELSPKRIANSLKFRASEIPHSFFWYFSKTAKSNRDKLDEYYNKHKDERCFIMANGPSLAKMDLSFLKNEITFGMNRIYLLFDQIEFLPTYYVSINGLVIEQFANDIQKLPMPKFLNWSKRNVFDQKDSSFLFLKLSLNPILTFQKSLFSPLSIGGTVTYITLQIAFFMGFKEVILIGLDHNYNFNGNPNIVQVRRTELDENHFAPNYFPKGIKWQTPDLLHSEQAYRLARINFEKDNRRIIDATNDGKCQIFDKENYLSFF